MEKTTSDHKVEQKIQEEVQNEESEKDLENDQNYIFARKLNNWFRFRTFGIIFFIFAILIVISFILMKYLNYYFNFGPMEKNVAEDFKNANWFLPFNRLNWAVFPNFQNNVENFNTPEGARSVVVIGEMNWAGTQMAVTRNALLINNIANGTLYAGTSICLVIGTILLLLHFFYGKPKAKALMALWTNTLDGKTAIKASKKEKETNEKPDKVKPSEKPKKEKAKKKKPDKDKPSAKAKKKSTTAKKPAAKKTKKKK